MQQPALFCHRCCSGFASRGIPHSSSSSSIPPPLPWPPGRDLWPKCRGTSLAMCVAGVLFSLLLLAPEDLLLCCGLLRGILEHLFSGRSRPRRLLTHLRSASTLMLVNIRSYFIFSDSATIQHPRTPAPHPRTPPHPLFDRCRTQCVRDSIHRTERISEQGSHLVQLSEHSCEPCVCVIDHHIVYSTRHVGDEGIS